MNNGVMVAGEGRSIWVVGDRYTIKCSGNDTSGAFAMMEAMVPPGMDHRRISTAGRMRHSTFWRANSSSMPMVAASPRLLEPG